MNLDDMTRRYYEENPDQLRSTWTPEEVLQVREVFGVEGEAEALDLFAPADWEEFQEIVPKDQLRGFLVSTRDSYRRKAARWEAARGMGFTLAEATLAGATANAIRGETGRA